jgi:hypothetical protein
MCVHYCCCCYYYYYYYHHHHHYRRCCHHCHSSSSSLQLLKNLGSLTYFFLWGCITISFLQVGVVSPMPNPVTLGGLRFSVRTYCLSAGDLPLTPLPLATLCAATTERIAQGPPLGGESLDLLVEPYLTGDILVFIGAYVLASVCPITVAASLWPLYLQLKVEKNVAVSFITFVHLHLTTLEQWNRFL